MRAESRNSSRQPGNYHEMIEAWITHPTPHLGDLVDGILKLVRYSTRYISGSSFLDGVFEVIVFESFDALENAFQIGLF